ncbi:MAG TPA: MFS transporter [Caulobacteraceae bacterium]|jgi:MFS family permease|nr:MFS transporter [Caulobacteraceae bacterium]
MTAQTIERPGGGLGTTYAYFGALTLLLYLASPAGYLVDFTTSYMLKNQLHLGPSAVANFRVLTAIPTYFAFVFGFTRDLWNPLGRRDRGYFMIFGPATALVFIWLAFTHLTYGSLLVGLLAVMFFSRFTTAAYQALIALVGQERLMSGRLSALWQIVSSIPVLLGALASGFFARYLHPTQTFLILAALCGGLGLMGLWKPRAVFAGAYEAPQAKGAGMVADLKRLVRHKAIYAPVLLILLFQFAPGANTPLQFYLSDKLHAPDTIYGAYYAIFAASFIPMFFIYGWLCKRVRLGKLLFWGIVISIPQMIPLALIHTAQQALWLAFPIGAMGGIVAAAIFDVSMRSCPPGMQGTLMMLVESANLLATRGSDLVGVGLYKLSPTYGFIYCVIAITIVYASMLPVMLLIPRHLLRTADGERDPEAEHEVLAELGEAGAPA